MTAERPKKYRQRGMGSLRLRGRLWVMRYTVNGEQRQESTGLTNKQKAQVLLNQRLADVAAGRAVVSAVEKTTFDDLVEMIRGDYTAHERRSVERLNSSVKHLSEAFGGYKAANVTTDRVRRYVTTRLGERAKRATINNELAALRRMFRLAFEAERVVKVPVIKALRVDNARRGFFEEEEFRRLLAHLPERLRPIAIFGYSSGWRREEVTGLRWEDVDLEAGTVRLDPSRSKNGEGRVLPIRKDPELVQLLQERLAATRALEKRTGQIIPWVFSYGGGVRGKWPGEQIRRFHGVWNKACTAAGCPGKLFHDLRRTAVRNFERNGVPRSTAMKLTGHKSEHVYVRYAIVSEEDMAEGLGKVARQRAEQRDQKDSRKDIGQI